jgi:hypothetical protein
MNKERSPNSLSPANGLLLMRVDIPASTWKFGVHGLVGESIEWNWSDFGARSGCVGKLSTGEILGEHRSVDEVLTDAVTRYVQAVRGRSYWK